MAQVILKKYLPQDIAVAAADAENYFSFFAVTGGNVSPVAKTQLSEIFSVAPCVYGYFNMEFPLKVAGFMVHDDYPGTLKFEFIFNTAFNAHSSLVNMLALNANKNSWTDEELGSLVSDDIKNHLSIWLLERVAEVPVANLKQYKAAAFLDDDAQKDIAGMLPGYFNGRYKDLDIEFISGTVDTYSNAVRELIKWANEQGISSKDATSIISQCNRIEDARLVLERMVWTTELAKKYGIDIEVVQGIVEKCRSKQEAEIVCKKYKNSIFGGDTVVDEDAERMKLAKAISEKTGLAFVEAQKIVAECPDLPTAKIKADEYIENHQAAVILKKYGFLISEAKEEVALCGGAQKALAVWETVEFLQNTYPDYKLKEKEVVAREIREKGIEKIKAEAAAQTQSKKNKMIGLVILLVVIAAVIGGVICYIRGLKEDFSIKVLSGTPVKLEKYFSDTFGNAFSYDTGSKTYSVRCARNEKLAFVEKLKQNGVMLESTDDPAVYVVPESWNKFTVKIFVSSREDFGRIVAMLADSNKMKVADSSYIENNFGVKIGTLSVNSVLDSGNAVKQELLSTIRSVISNFQDRSIKVQ